MGSLSAKYRSLCEVGGRGHRQKPARAEKSTEAGQAARLHACRRPSGSGELPQAWPGFDSAQNNLNQNQPPAQPRLIEGQAKLQLAPRKRDMEANCEAESHCCAWGGENPGYQSQTQPRYSISTHVSRTWSGAPMVLQTYAIIC